MKSFRTMKFAALLALAVGAVASQDAQLLRRELKTGTTETYKIENEMKQVVEIPSMGEQDMVMSTVATVAVKTGTVNAEKGTADVEATTKIEKFAMDGSIAAMMGGGENKLPDPKTEKGTLDSRNRLIIPPDPKSKPSGAGGMAAMGVPSANALGAMSLLTLVELPEKPVKLGDVIEVSLPGAAAASTMGIKDLKMTMKLSGEKEVEGQKVWVVTYTGNLKLDLDTSKLPKQPGQAESPMGEMKITGTAQIDGEGLVDKTTGKTVSNAMNIKNDAKLFLQAMGAELPIKGTVKMKLSLVK